MLDSEILEVAIGIIFVYILVCIICSAVREGIESLMKTRSAHLEHGIRELLHDKEGTDLARSFFNHPLIYGLFLDDYEPRPAPTRSRWRPWARTTQPRALARGSSLPSYIPAKSFALALMDMAARGRATDSASSSPGSEAISLQSIRDNVLNLGNERVQRVLLTAVDTAQGDLDRVQANLEAWYDSSMDRVSGWYKRSTQWVLFWIGLALAIGMNVNTITIADYLYRNDAARVALVARAEAAARDSTFVQKDYTRAREALDSLRLPIGWTPQRPKPKEVDTWQEEALYFAVVPMFGWLLTAIAATLGAPFWFDVLNKVMVIRSTVKPHEKSPEEDSEDRQLRSRAPVQDGAGRPQPAMGGGAATAAPAAAGAAADPGDAEADIDACDLEIEEVTRDDELPAAEGGVA